MSANITKMNINYLLQVNFSNSLQQ